MFFVKWIVDVSTFMHVSACVTVTPRSQGGFLTLRTYPVNARKQSNSEKKILLFLTSQMFAYICVLHRRRVKFCKIQRLAWPVITDLTNVVREPFHSLRLNYFLSFHFCLFSTSTISAL